MSSSKDKRVEPRLAKGMIDLDPARARARQRIVEIIAEVYEGYGFMPLSTPAIERWETLVGRAAAMASLEEEGFGDHTYGESAG